jgi:DNA-binding HxlR family transcriptional regulator
MVHPSRLPERFNRPDTAVTCGLQVTTGDENWQALPADRAANMERMTEEARVSSLQAALDRVGDRWSLLVVESLLVGPRRFNDLQASLAGIAPNILSERLKRLERERVLLARPYSERPLRLTYELTADGRALAGALRLLANWGARADPTDSLRHQTCGTPLEARWYCPTCARSIDDSDTTELRQL